ncbi:MAG: AEC family transporter [Rhodocyclaceae bacterium]
MIESFLRQIVLAAPLFGLVFLGWGVMRVTRLRDSIARMLSRFVFTVALPALLFRMMSDFSRLPAVDARLLFAFFGGCLLVFAAGRIVAWRIFGMDGVAQSVFALGGIFSNNVLLGVPLARAALGEAAAAPVALVLVFNALILWTLVTVSVEWSRHGTFTAAGFLRTARGVITNPIVASIVGGTLFGLAGLHIPEALDVPLAALARSASPLALLALGMGLAGYDIRSGWRVSVAISFMKLAVQPFAVWGLARLLGLPLLETQAVTLLASLSVGVNVYLMARQFRVLEGPVAASLVLSTAAAALTTPLALALVASASQGA